MRVKVRLYQPFSGIVGRGELVVTLESGILGALLSKLSSEYPGIKDQIFNKEGGVMDHLNIFVNQVPVTSDMETTMAIKDGDEVILMMAVAGG